jgi:hypothetical protein
VAHGWHLETREAISGPPPRPFDQDQWDANRQLCHAQATEQVAAVGGASFANAFDGCMKAHGL